MATALRLPAQDGPPGAPRRAAAREAEREAPPVGMGLLRLRVLARPPCARAGERAREGWRGQGGWGGQGSAAGKTFRPKEAGRRQKKRQDHLRTCDMNSLGSLSVNALAVGTGAERLSGGAEPLV